MFSKGMSLPSDFLQNIFWDVVFDLYIDYYFGKDLDNKTSNLEQAQTYLMNANIQMETFHNTWNQFQSETTWDKAKVLRYMSIAGLKNLRDSLKPLALPASFEGKSGFWLYKGKVKKIDITEKTNYQNNDAGTYLLEIEVPAGALAVKASTSVSPLIDKYKTEDGTYDRWFAATQASGLDFLEGHVRWELSQLVKWKWQGSIDDPSNYASWKTGQKWAGYVFPSITATKGTLSLDLDRKWGSEVVRQLTAHDRDIHVDILIDETKSLTTAKYPITQMIDQIESLGRENTIVIQKK
jgi:hypothetical protein